MLKNLVYLSFTFFFCLSCTAQDDSTSFNFDKFIKYKDRYKVECVDQKITDNRGEGYEELYGTRNFRVILHGVATEEEVIIIIIDQINETIRILYQWTDLIIC